MKTFKKHIAIGFLLGFLLPQVSSVMHYVIIPHRIPEKKALSYQIKGNDFLWNACKWHIHATNALLKELFDQPLMLAYSIYSPNALNGLVYYVHQPDYHFSLRGPPPLKN